MKKLFALILTLVMVFAIAAPALAAPSWGAGTPNAGSAFTIAVAPYKVTYDAIGNPSYSDLGNAAVVQGTPVAFKITVKVPKAADLAAYYYDNAAYTLDAGAELTNLTGVTLVGTSANFAATSNKLITITLPTPGSQAQTISATFTATIEKTAKATVEAYAGYEAPSTVADVKYAGFTFSNTAAAATITNTANNSVLTLTKSSNVVTGWSIANGANEYTVMAGPIFVQTAGTGAGTIITATSDPAAFATINGLYKAFTGLLGFDVTTTGIYFTNANIITNYAAGGYAEAVATFNPYNANLTVTDGSQVPNTGDNMSVIGFVMVGLALLATAAVVVKKVRA